MSVLSDKHFHDEKAAYKFVEARVWPNGPVCPHCGTGDRIGKLNGKSTRIGTYKCYACRKPFTVKIGTIFEASHVPLHIWLQALFLMSSSKKGISSNQLHRTLGVTLKTAWFMSHRIREAMRTVGLEPMGGAGKTVEADETFVGRKAGTEIARGAGHKMKVLSLVERGGPVRSIVMNELTRASVSRVVLENVRHESRLMTDTAPYYVKPLGFAEHHKVDHSMGEYVRGDAYVNTLEGYFSLFKKGMRGIYQHCAEKHLHRYLAEFDFRYNERAALGVNDEIRAARALQGVVGKRLKYQTT
jgi:transposase-like protein